MPASFTCEYCEQFTAPDRKAIRSHQTNLAGCRRKRDNHLQQLRAQFALSSPASGASFPVISPHDHHQVEDHTSHFVEDALGSNAVFPPATATDPAIEDEIIDMIENIHFDAPPPPPLFQPSLDNVIISEPPTVDADARRPQVELEDVIDEDDLDYYLREFPSEKEAGAVFGGDSRTLFHAIRDDQILKGDEILGPFRDDGEWELAKWLIKNVGHTQADIFLKLPIVSLCPPLPMETSSELTFFRFKTKRSLRSAIKRNFFIKLTAFQGA